MGRVDGQGGCHRKDRRQDQDNWTGLFRPGEKVRLRLINAAAGSFFDVRIPGLSMTVVQADGQNVEPVTVDEIRVAIAETYDVIVEPVADRAYTIFAESMDRSGYGRATLAPREGMSAEIPARRERPLRTMADMGMGDMQMDGMEMDDMEMGGGGAAPLPPGSASQAVRACGQGLLCTDSMYRFAPRPTLNRLGTTGAGPANASTPSEIGRFGWV